MAGQGQRRIDVHADVAGRIRAGQPGPGRHVQDRRPRLATKRAPSAICGDSASRCRNQHKRPMSPRVSRIELGLPELPSPCSHTLNWPTRLGWGLPQCSHACWLGRPRGSAPAGTCCGRGGGRGGLAGLVHALRGADDARAQGGNRRLRRRQLRGGRGVDRDGVQQVTMFRQVAGIGRLAAGSIGGHPGHRRCDKGTADAARHQPITGKSAPRLLLRPVSHLCRGDPPR